MAFKKKLYKCRPIQNEKGNVEARIESQVNHNQTRKVDSDPASLERGVRQLLADKVSGHLAGVWLLVAEHLRLGTWDLLCGWTGQPTERVEPRLAMQLVQEAALCTQGIRSDRTLTNRGGFELANGLPFVASDSAIHSLLNEHTVAEAEKLQIALGKIRRVSKHFQGRVLAVDPHRKRSFSKRHMRKHAAKSGERPRKVSQMFWLLDADTHQPLCFTIATSARTITQATPSLLQLGGEILGLEQELPVLVLADAEHLSADLFGYVAQQPKFELVTPMPSTKPLLEKLRAIPESQFIPRWAGFATCKQPYRFLRGPRNSYTQYVQRSGERPEDWRYVAFLSSTDGDEVDTLTTQFPKRWHIEEFFNANQALGWKRAGTQNLNIRYGQMTMALIAQTAIHQLRTRLGEPLCQWDATHLARDLFQALDGDVRVTKDTILVTYYNAPNAELLARHYEGLPEKLQQEHIDPHIPWLYNFKLDFRFR